MMRPLAVIAFGASCLLGENEPRQTVQVTNTQRVDFASGGVLKLTNSIGELAVQGWDRPYVEITTIKSTKGAYTFPEREKATQELDKVLIAVERQGDELAITT